MHLLKYQDNKNSWLVPSPEKKKILPEHSWYICHLFLKPNDK